MGDELLGVDRRYRITGVAGFSTLKPGARLASVSFHGRWLWLSFGERVLVVHVTPWTHVAVVPPPKKRCGLRVRLSGGTVWVSASHTVSARVTSPAAVRRLVAKLGPMPLRYVTAAEIRARAAWFSVATTADALLDQRVVAGIGPRLASEALYSARVDPMLPASIGVRYRLAHALAVAVARALESPDSAVVARLHRVPPTRSDTLVYARRRAACSSLVETFSAVNGVVHVVSSRFLDPSSCVISSGAPSD